MTDGLIIHQWCAPAESRVLKLDYVREGSEDGAVELSVEAGLCVWEDSEDGAVELSVEAGLCV